MNSTVSTSYCVLIRLHKHNYLLECTAELHGVFLIIILEEELISDGGFVNWSKYHPPLSVHSLVVFRVYELLSKVIELKTVINKLITPMSSFTPT